jgi:shikimate dehydrogenase
MMAKTLKLGLIGDNIDRSQSPHLHKTCGQIAGVAVTYDRLIPQVMRMSFDEVFAKAHTEGFQGINVTYPYKESVRQFVTVADPAVRAIGAVNTVLFSPDGPQGFNTDYSGFVQAYKAARDTPPGTVCLIGAGGVGKAVAFALLALKADKIICVDIDCAKVDALAQALKAAGTGTQIVVSDTPQEAAGQADGIINCTPLGMVNIGGTPLPASAMTRANWAFDAVYTPVETQFLQDARRAGLTVISGYELFLGQGLDAWALFSGQQPDRAAVRAQLLGERA